MTNPSRLEMSFRRSPRREQVVLMLASLSEASPAALARACGIDCRRLHWILHGREHTYAFDLSPIPMGLVEEVQLGRRKVYRITQRGRKKARQITSRHVRKAIAKRAVREHFRAAKEGPAPLREQARIVESPAATSSFSWSTGCGSS